MREIWSDRRRFELWLQVEILACEAWADLGRIPVADLAPIRAASFQLDRILEIEGRVGHDVIAFLTAVGETVGPAARHLHLGMTSSDVVDTGLALQAREAAALILGDLGRVREAAAALAVAHRRTLMVGRTHGIHAEPVTFGLKFAIWHQENRRNLQRLAAAAEDLRLGKISGAVGTYAHLGPDIEARICRRLGLEPAPVSNQVIQRDRHAAFLCVLAVAASTLDKIALEIRHLQRTEVREAEEYFAAGQKGSSAMPHKRNPVTCEQICGLARVVRANAQAGLENVALWHERDISHSSVERIILPDSCVLLDYMTAKMTGIVDRLLVYPDRMRANLEATRGLVFSGQLLLDLAESGLSREDAYRLVQKHAMESWRTGADFRVLIESDPEIATRVPAATIAAAFDLDRHLRHVDALIERALA